MRQQSFVVTSYWNMGQLLRSLLHSTEQWRALRDRKQFRSSEVSLVFLLTLIQRVDPAQKADMMASFYEFRKKNTKNVGNVFLIKLIG
jgi:hypothetical protein